MITQFKIYETVYYQPRQMKIGDYVVALNVDFSDVAISDEIAVVEYLKTHVGEITGLEPIMVRYIIDDDDYILKVIGEQFYLDGKTVVVEFMDDEIPMWSDSKEELEIEIEANKYNL